MKIMFYLLVIFFMQDARSQSLGSSASKAADIIGKVNQSAPLNSDLTKTIPNYTTASPSEENYSNSNISDAATQKALTDPAAKMINQSFATRPDIKIDRNTSPIFKNAKTITDNPTAIINNLTGQYGQCQAQTTTTTTTTDIRTCDEYTQETDQSCLVGDVVTVDAAHKYQCNRSRIYNDYTCNKTLNLTCVQQGCDAGILAPGQFNQGSVNIITSNMTPDTPNVTWSYIYPSLKISETVPNPTGWAGSFTLQNQCSWFSRAIHFTISDLSKLSKFTLSKISFTAFIEIKINGTIIYDAPWTPIGDSYALTFSSAYYKYNGVLHQCAGSSAYNNSVSINLLPYIKQGDNTIEIVDVFAAANVPYEIDIDTAQVCCAQWNESWSDNCTGYE